jgi:peroxiredoxin Q/BCP
VVLGVSPDPVKSHVKFKAKYDLPFTLLADEDHAVCEAYDVWKEKSMYGRKYMGVERSTFLIDAKGKLVRAWIKVTPKGHAEEVAEAVKALG